MSKLSFRARALDASKPMPIFMAEELPDLPDYSAINRAVPQMPSGMEKEEECEHHLQRAIVTGLIIPTPEVTDITDKEAYEKLYPANYKQPRQLIHMQPFAMEQDIIDYDMDSEDERWLMSQTQKLELSPLKFEEMMDKLEKSSGQTVVTLNEAKALLKEDDDLIIAVYDYWLNKRLKTQHTLIPQVKTEHRAGIALNNPYLAFRRRTEKMQTRKNRKNDESSYEKMLKLRRDLCRAVTLLELVKRREKIKREYVHLTIEVFEKRYQARDFSGAVLAELSSIKTSRPAFTPIFHNHYSNQNWTNSKAALKDEDIPRKEKRQYKKRKHKLSNHHRVGVNSSGLEGIGGISSDEETAHPANSEPEDVEDEGQFVFRRNKLCSYHMPRKELGNWPWCPKEENGLADKRYRYTLTSLSNRRCVGFARRRLGRGGRVILDRTRTDLDDFWRTVDFTILEPTRTIENIGTATTLAGAANFTKSYPTNFFASSNSSVGDMSKTNLKIEPLSFYSDGSLRQLQQQQRTCVGAASASVSSDSIDKRSVVKEEPVDLPDEWSVPAETCSDVHVPIATTAQTQEEQDEMVEFLKEVRRDWLHFRPKTPPPDYEPPCHLLPTDDETFIPGANTPFTLELQPLDAPSSVLSDTSAFVTTPFTLDDLYAVNAAVVPITDTRQFQSTPPPQPSSNDVDYVNETASVAQTGINLNVNVGLSTLSDASSSSSSSSSPFEETRTIGSSRFVVTNATASNECEEAQRTSRHRHYNNSNNQQQGMQQRQQQELRLQSPQQHSFLLSTLTSPKANNVHSPFDERLRHASDNVSATATTTSGSTNGLLAQFSLNASTSDKMKLNKLQPYAYISGEGSSASPNQLSVRTSTHTHNTLNSHSSTFCTPTCPPPTKNIYMVFYEDTPIPPPRQRLQHLDELVSR
ncbi:uncharacterized protein LOC108742649 isoform X2 [Agrilus planipennis]|uniref:Enhancer of polycomb-like protein n=1 Tax=Agrilus planipennis TaxID=224129 RepID=A0A1W4XLS0_AGRPL|nr:uncharacterized protein LOC108742649 isoform X2 [Agrilus planipennis]